MFASVIAAIITGSAPHPLWSPRWQKWSSPACATPSPNSPSLGVLWWLLPRALWFSSWDCRVSLRFCRSTVTSTAWAWHHWPANLICGVCVCVTGRNILDKFNRHLCFQLGAAHYLSRGGHWLHLRLWYGQNGKLPIHHLNPPPSCSWVSLLCHATKYR